MTLYEKLVETMCTAFWNRRGNFGSYKTLHPVGRKQLHLDMEAALSALREAGYVIISAEDGEIHP